MLELTSADTFEIAGRGTVYTFTGVPGLNPRKLLGQRVQINGMVMTVRGVETFAIIDPTGVKFGLLVKPGGDDE